MQVESGIGANYRGRGLGLTIVPEHFVFFHLWSMLDWIRGLVGSRSSKTDQQGMQARYTCHRYNWIGLVHLLEVDCCLYVVSWSLKQSWHKLWVPVAGN